MYISHLLAALERQGIAARPWHIRHIIASRKISELKRDVFGRFIFSEAHLATIGQLLVNKKSGQRQSTARRTKA